MEIRNPIRLAYGLGLLVCLSAVPGLAQSPEDIELRKSAGQTKLRFGAIGVLEDSIGLNKDRPEHQMSLYVAPALKIGAAMRAQVNFRFGRDMLSRMDNYGWWYDDLSIEFAHNQIYKEPVTGITFSGRVRYYVPMSKQSRLEGSLGQLRGYLKTSVSLWKFYLAAELNGQKYFHKHTTWDTGETPGSSAWYHQGGRDEAIDNNSSFGFGETFTATFTPFDGLDLSVIWGLYQNRRYQPSKDHSADWGSSFLQDARWTTWSHNAKFIADVTYGIGAIPGISTSEVLKDSVLNNFYLSAGYYSLAPQLQLEGAKRSLNPFNPKYASIYFDLTFVY